MPILKKIQDVGIPKIIRKALGDRVKQAKYAYHDAFIGWTLAALCGCKRIEQITQHRKKLAVIPGLNLPSHDTVGRIMKKLATEVKVHRNISQERNAKLIYTYYNDNPLLNEILINSTKAVHALKEGIKYTLDIDAMFIETLRRGALRNVDKNGKLLYSRIGFYPMVCLIGDMPVFISMRNGNAGPSFQIEECLSNCLAMLDKANIQIGRVVSDAAGFNKNLMRSLDKRGIKFNIRYPYRKNFLSFHKELKACKKWRKTEIETANCFWNCEIADITHAMFQHYTDEEHAGTYRVVTIRIPVDRDKNRSLEESEHRQAVKAKLFKLSEKKLLKEAGKPFDDTNWKEIDGFHYKFFITNDYEKSSEEIVKEYNKRGNAERKFSFMKNDFAWNCMPFMEMNENLVFMFAAALANNIFRGVLGLFKEKVPGIKLTNRLPKFKAIFIEVSCAIARTKFTFFSQDILYEELML